MYTGCSCRVKEETIVWHAARLLHLKLWVLWKTATAQYVMNNTTTANIRKEPCRLRLTIADNTMKYFRRRGLYPVQHLQIHNAARRDSDATKFQFEIHNSDDSAYILHAAKRYCTTAFKVTIKRNEYEIY